MKKHNAKGFTLIEVTIALVVFIVAVAGIAALQKASKNGVIKSKEQMAAVNIAKYFLTQLQNEVTSWAPSPANAMPNNCGQIVDAIQGDLPLLAAHLDHGNCQPFDTSAPNNLWLAVDNTWKIDPFLGHSQLAYTSETSRQAMAMYCVNYMVEPMANTVEVSPPFNPATVMSWLLRVRVFWPGAGQHEGWGIDVCSPDTFTVEELRNSARFVEFMAIARRG
jgi:type II secretory pathway pseudopilin PulG